MHCYNDDIRTARTIVRELNNENFVSPCLHVCSVKIVLHISVCYRRSNRIVPTWIVFKMFGFSSGVPFPVFSKFVIAI